MARMMEPTPEDEAMYRDWLADRPDLVRAVATRFDPWSLYRLKTSQHRVSIVAFDEHLDGAVSLTVAVTGQFNAILFDRHVFGINPDDLEPCDLPSADEQTGTLMSSDEVDANIDTLREFAGIEPKR